jgi:hypothetical protein
MHSEFYLEKLNERDNLADLGIVRRIILKLMLEKLGVSM